MRVPPAAAEPSPLQITLKLRQTHSYSTHWSTHSNSDKQVTHCCILFVNNIFKVNAEFLRITTKPLQSKFMYQLDHFSDKLLQIFTSKGGVKGKKIKEALAITDSVSTNAFFFRYHVLLRDISTDTTFLVFRQPLCRTHIN